MSALPRSTLVCDVARVEPDLRTIDELARLQLAARRTGFDLRLQAASRELRELIAFVGLERVLRVEPVGQPEEREQRLRVEEERQLDDPPA